jgi:hypothetical protein
MEKLGLAQQGKPGSACPKKFLTFNSEFTNRNICTASRKFQEQKLAELQVKLEGDEYLQEYENVIDKSCLCTGLANSALKSFNANKKADGEGVLVCPGPNLAYFSKVASLKEMADHIYGRTNIITRTDRPHMFIKELGLYIEFLKDKIQESAKPTTVKESKYLLDFHSNLEDGIDYYKKLFSSFLEKVESFRKNFKEDLEELEDELKLLKLLILEGIERENIMS